jgi:hypothetical protein
MCVLPMRPVVVNKYRDDVLVLRGEQLVSMRDLASIFFEELWSCCKFSSPEKRIVGPEATWVFLGRRMIRR